MVKLRPQGDAGVGSGGRVGRGFLGRAREVARMDLGGPAGEAGALCPGTWVSWALLCRIVSPRVELPGFSRQWPDVSPF